MKFIIAILVLILIVVDNGLVHPTNQQFEDLLMVLILIVVDNGLVHVMRGIAASKAVGLNPYCSGQWSRTITIENFPKRKENVLILIVVDNGLVLNPQIQNKSLC